MSSLIYTTATSDADLLGIIDLQKNNLPVNLTNEEKLQQGFVTVVHSLADLKKMNDAEQHIICKNGGKVIAYLLAMTAAAKNDIPVLVPMFEMFTTVLYKDKAVSEYNYIVVGQVCVDRDYRGQGVLDQCYQTYKARMNKKYDFAITEIATRNQRSIKAHQRVGFTELKQYTSPANEVWNIVIWQW
jgi:predicted GNAT superfamily acetyltransferase